MRPPAMAIRAGAPQARSFRTTRSGRRPVAPNSWLPPRARPPGHELPWIGGFLTFRLKQLLLRTVAIEPVQIGTDVRKTCDGLVKIARAFQVALRQRKILGRLRLWHAGLLSLLQLLLGAKEIPVRLLFKFARARLETQTLRLGEFRYGAANISKVVNLKPREAEMGIGGSRKIGTRLIKTLLGAKSGALVLRSLKQSDVSIDKSQLASHCRIGTIQLSRMLKTNLSSLPLEIGERGVGTVPVAVDHIIRGRDVTGPQ